MMSVSVEGFYRNGSKAHVFQAWDERVEAFKLRGYNSI
ncbi:hypothetical protein CKA32_005409 [Geitlerinema sp. FC II]|nr:hypothetical protein CKA32_005409 [Geitlerinema sp. FC II]